MFLSFVKTHSTFNINFGLIDDWYESHTRAAINHNFPYRRKQLL